MTDSQLQQSRGILRIEAEILPDGVRHREKGFLKSHESTVRFEEIPDEITRVFHVSRLYLAISAFFAFLFLYRLYGFAIEGSVSGRSLGVAIIWFLMAAGGTWMQSPKWVGFVGPTASLLFFDTAGKHDPSWFLKESSEAKNRYMAVRYRGAITRSPSGDAADDFPSDKDEKIN